MTGSRTTSSAPGREPVRAGSDLLGKRFERSVRRWMRAYPRRWRQARGEELLGVLQDLAGPDADRLGARGALDLVRSGWATRWREHPPLGRWLAYRLLDRELPDHRAWARDDIEGALYGVRSRLLIPALPAVLVAASEDGPVRWVWFVLAIAAVLVVPTSRHRQLVRHLTGAQDGRVYGGRLSVEPAPRARTEAVSGLRWFAVCAAVVAGASLVAVLRSPVGTWVRAIPAGFETGTGPVVDRWPAVVAVLVAVVAGLVMAVVVRRRVRRLVHCSGYGSGQGRPAGHGPAGGDRGGHGLGGETGRRTRPVSGGGAASAVALTALAVAETWAESVGALVAGPSVILACAAGLVLPGSVVALAVLRRAVRADRAADGPEPVAAVDVWRAATNRRPRPDVPVPVLVPVPAPSPADADPARPRRAEPRAARTT